MESLPVRKVVIIQKFLTQYRERFYELLRSRLEKAGVELVLIYGQPSEKEAAKKDQAHISWATYVRSRILQIGSTDLYWQPCFPYLKGANLVVVEQANKLLINYVLIVQNMLGIRRVAYWGHGNPQTVPQRGPSAYVRRFLLRKVHWWFAYTAEKARVVANLGFPSDHITDVQNAMDTYELIDEHAKLTEADLDCIRQHLGLKGTNVAIYSGAMYAEKGLLFLLEACELIRKEVPDFEVLFLGAGPDEQLVKQVASSTDWTHYIGPVFGRSKVPYFKLSKVLLMPGAVGLVVLDSFALETPMVTTDLPTHGPELAYLIPGVNGCKTAHDVRHYATAVIELLKQEQVRARLVAGCRESRRRYTVEAMADRFAEGILAAVQ